MHATVHGSDLLRALIIKALGKMIVFSGWQDLETRVYKSRSVVGIMLAGMAEVWVRQLVEAGRAGSRGEHQQSKALEDPQ